MLYDLELKIGGESWNKYFIRELDPAFEAFSKRILDRDKYRCQFCGFQASTGMKVVNLDHDYTNNKMGNLVTSCPFCQQCLFIEVTGRLQEGGGTLIYLPELSQGQLNAMCHVYYASLVNGSTQATVADQYIQALKLRSSLVEKQFGDKMSDPAFMGRMLIDTPVEDLELRRETILKGLRLLPSLESFEQQILSWAGSAMPSGN